MVDKRQIKHMVERFLSWRLPTDFRPDAGISFEANYDNGTRYGGRHVPVGTNLFSHVQAEEMVRHMIEGLPSGDVEPAQRSLVSIIAERIDPPAWQAGRAERPWGTYADRRNAAHDIAVSILRTLASAEWPDDIMKVAEKYGPRAALFEAALQTVTVQGDNE